MGIPAYQAAGAGVATATAGANLDVEYPTGIIAGNILIIQGIYRDNTGTLSTPTGFTLLYGPDAAGTTLRQWIFGKIADGTETGTITVTTTSSTILRAARMYRFDGCKGGITDTSGYEGGNTQEVTTSSVPDAGVTTSGSNRLALNFIGISDNSTLGAFTGESGGDWIEAVAGFSTNIGLDGHLQLQTATMVSSGTINGGSYTMSAADPGIVRGFALIGSPVISGVSIASTAILYSGSLRLNISGVLITSSNILYSGTLKLNIIGSFINSTVTLYSGALKLNISGGYRAPTVVLYSGTISSGISIIGSFLSSGAIIYPGSPKLNISGVIIDSTVVLYPGALPSDLMVLGTFITSNTVLYPGILDILQLVAERISSDSTSINTISNNKNTNISSNNNKESL